MQTIRGKMTLRDWAVLPFQVIEFMAVLLWDVITGWW
jgi:hypothetical protein